MQPYQRVLAAILDSRSAYDTFRQFGNKDEFGAVGTLVVDAVCKYYELDPGAKSVDRTLLSERLVASLANPKHGQAVRDYLHDVPVDVSAPNVEHDIRELHIASLYRELSVAAANQDYKRSKTLREALTKAESGESSGRSDVRYLHAKSALEDSHGRSDEGLIHLWPDKLNDKLDGGAGKGNLVIVFARPNKGKTLFVVNLCAGFMRQGFKVLYLGNEEPTWRIRERLTSRLLRASKEAVRKSPQKAAEALARIKGDLAFVDLEANTFAEVEKAVDGYKPDVVVIDQLHKLAVVSDTHTNALEAAAAAARNLAKRRNVLVVATTQAGNSAEEKVILSMTDVDSSKTGIPANADLMIGLGGTRQMWDVHGVIEIAIVKNKLSGDHSNLTVSVNKLTGELT